MEGGFETSEGTQLYADGAGAEVSARALFSLGFRWGSLVLRHRLSFLASLKRCNQVAPSVHDILPNCAERKHLLINVYGLDGDVKLATCGSNIAFNALQKSKTLQDFAGLLVELRQRFATVGELSRELLFV
jgi:hypothetical protein